MGSATFRQKNSAGDLAAIFKNLRDRFEPRPDSGTAIHRAATIDQGGFLKLVGFFPTQPLQVKFALAFQRVEAGWMIDSISVGAVETRR